MSTYNGESADANINSIDFGNRYYKKNRGLEVEFLTGGTSTPTVTTYFCELINGSYQHYTSIGSIPSTAIILRITRT